MASEINNECGSVSKQQKYKLTLLATQEVRDAFDELVYKEYFAKSSEVILKYVFRCLSTAKNEEDLSIDVKYVIRRLVAALASTRMYAQQGAYATLEIMLQLHPEIVSYARFYIDQYYNDVKKTDALGLVLAQGALIRSGCCLGDVSYTKSIVKKLGKFASNKGYIEPIAGHFVVNLLTMCSDENLVRFMWSEFQAKIEEPMEKLSSFFLWLRFIFCSDKYIKTLTNVRKKLQQCTYDPDSYAFVAQKFKILSNEKVNITLMMEDYLNSLFLYKKNGPGADNIANFFSLGLNQLLRKNSRLKKYESDIKNVVFVFNIAQMALPYLSTEGQVEKVLSLKLLEVIIFSKSLKCETLNASARGLMGAILQQIIKNKDDKKEMQFILFKQLISTSVFLKFDKITGTTLFRQAYENFNVPTIKRLSQFLHSKLSAEDYSPKKEMILSNAMAAAMWISWLVCHHALDHSEHITKWKASQIAALLEFGFFREHSPQNKQQLNTLYLRALNQNVTTLEDQVVIAELVLEKAKAYLRKDPKHRVLNEEAKACFSEVSLRIEEIKQNCRLLGEKDSLVFRLLFGQICLHLFVTPETSMELIREIKQCYKKAVKSSCKRKTSSPGDRGSNPEPERGEGIVDLLLEILANEESLWKKLAKNIFRAICSTLSPCSLSLITDIIDPRKQEQSLGPDLDQDDEEVDADDEGKIVNSMEGKRSSEKKNKGDEEMLSSENEGDSNDNDGNGNDDEHGTDECDYEEDEDKSDESEDEDDEDDGVQGNKKAGKLMALKMQMQKLVGVPTDVDIDIDSLPEEELNKLDALLGPLVGEFISSSKRKKPSKEQLRDETTLINFRVRACDLLETLIEEAPSLGHLLPLLHPLLLALYRTPKEGANLCLNQKLKSVLNALSKVKKFAISGDVSSEDLATEISSLIDLADKLSGKVNVEIDNCLVFLLRASTRSPAAESGCDEVFKVFARYVDHVITKRNDRDIPKAPLFLNTGSLSHVLDTLLKVTFHGSTRPFRKKQGLEMIKLILLNSGAISQMPQGFVSDVYDTITEKVTLEFDSVTIPTKMQSAFLVAIVDFLKAIRNLRKPNSGESGAGLDWKKIFESLTAFQTRIPMTEFKQLKKAFAKINFFNNKRACPRKFNAKTDVQSRKPEGKPEVNASIVHKTEAEIDANTNQKSKKKTKKRKLELEEEEIEQIGSAGKTGTRTKQKKSRNETNIHEQNPEDYFGLREMQTEKCVKAKQKKLKISEDIGALENDHEFKQMEAKRAKKREDGLSFEETPENQQRKTRKKIYSEFVNGNPDILLSEFQQNEIEKFNKKKNKSKSRDRISESCD